MLHLNRNRQAVGRICARRRSERILTCVIIIEEGAVKVKVGIGKTVYLKAGKAGENGVQTAEEKGQYILIVAYEQ